MNKYIFKYKQVLGKKVTGTGKACAASFSCSLKRWPCLRRALIFSAKKTKNSGISTDTLFLEYASGIAYAGLAFFLREKRKN